MAIYANKCVSWLMARTLFSQNDFYVHYGLITGLITPIILSYETNMYGR